MFKVHQALRTVRTTQYGQYYDLTQLIEEEVQKSDISDGVLIVSILHTTTGITAQEPDIAVHRDGKMILENVAPTRLDYEHTYEGLLNATAHQKQMLIGNSRIVPVKDSCPVLGTWQRLFLLELFRPMERKVFITVLGASRRNMT